MKPRNLALVTIALALCVALGLLRLTGTTNAQPTWNADKAVTGVTFDKGNNYPHTGTPITGPIRINSGEPQTVISVTSMDVLQSLQAGGPPLNSLVAFYADIPPSCWGRWYDPGSYFPWDIYTAKGQPTAEPFSPAQLGTPVPTPTAAPALVSKVPGDVDNNPPLPGPGLPVPGETFEVDLHFQTLQYDINELVMQPVPITRFFDFHCDVPGEYVFWFCNKIEPILPYVDPDFPPGPWPGDNVLCAPLTVNVSKGVGGTQGLPDTAESAAAAESSGGSSLPYVAVAGAAIGLVVLGAGGWYARRRWLS
jgi:hypothetical protein